MDTRKPYPSDLTDEQWQLVEPLLPKKRRGRNAKHSRREMLDALLYLVRSGCAWRMLPHDFPPWESVYAFWRRLVERNQLEKINDALRVQVRLKEEREAEPSVAIIDSQSVQTAEKKGAVGFDRHKQRKGSKRQLIVDTQGWVIRVMVHPANEQDRAAARWLLKRLPLFQRLQLFLFDRGYDSPALLHWCQQVFGVDAQIARRQPATNGFQVQPKRWIVERTFAWLSRFRRLSKDYEQSPRMSESFVYLAMSHLMLRRLAR